MKIFGDYIRSARVKRGLTLTKLAALLDIDSANLSKIETGKRDFDEKKIERIANIFEEDATKLASEYYSEKIAKKIYTLNNSKQILCLAEEKVKYLKQQNVEQGKIKF